MIEQQAFKEKQVGEIIGIVNIKAFNAKTGALLWEMEDKNLITYGIRDVLAELLIQQSLLVGVRTTAQLQVATMKMSTSNASPARSHTSLQAAPIITKTFLAGDVAKIAAGEYTFVATLQPADGNGTIFQEVGLFTSDDTMLSRQVHAPFTKDITMTVQYTWTYVFS